VPISICDNEFDVELDRALCNRYKLKISYNHVYLDFDDCICIKGKLNPEIIKFIVASRNDKKQIHLLSKHRGNLTNKLKDFRIESLFDSINQIDDTKEKAEFITHKESILIDDSFNEREKVHSALGIPCFAPDAIEGLI
jgi:hypothetical protein